MGLYRLYIFFFFQETLNLSEKLELHNKVDFDNSLPPTIRGNLKSISASWSGYTGFTFQLIINALRRIGLGEAQSALC